MFYSKVIDVFGEGFVGGVSPDKILAKYFKANFLHKERLPFWVDLFLVTPVNSEQNEVKLVLKASLERLWDIW